MPIVFGIATSLPILPSQGLLSFHDLQRIAQCVTLVFAALWLFTIGMKHPPRIALSTRVCLSSLALILFLGCLRAEHSLAAFQEAALWVGLFAWLAICRQLTYRAEESYLLRAGALCMLTYGVLVLILYGITATSSQKLDARALIVGFDNPRFLNHLQTVAVPLLWVTATADSGKWWRRAAQMAAILHIALAALVIARATLLAWIVALTLLTVAREIPVRRQGWFCLIVGIASAALIFVVGPAVLNLTWSPSFAAPKDVGSAHSRDILWMLAVDQALNNPWLGTGPMHFAAQLNTKAAHPHNIFLQLAAEIGIPGSFLFVALLLTPVVRAAKLIRKVPNFPLLAASFAATTAAIIDGGLSGNFVMPLSQLWIATAWGLLTGAIGRAATPTVVGADQRGAVIRRVAIIGLLASQLGLCAIAAIQIGRDPPRIQADSPVPAPGTPYRPRFWLSGWI